MVAPASYTDIFNRRGYLYHRAMAAYPDARAEEFIALLELVRINDGDIICDAPSGGGYLGRFADKQVKIIHVETSAEFFTLCRPQHNDEKILCAGLEQLPLPDNSLNAVLSLAGLHHMTEVERFYREAHRLLKPGGALCVADVAAGSRPARFLNEFLDQHCLTGHKGAFLDKDATVRQLESAGFTVEYADTRAYHWRFPSREAMIAFMKDLFGMEHADESTVLRGVEEVLGYENAAGDYCVPWELLFFRAVKG